MGLTISWSTEAIADYASNVDYLLTDWSFKDAEEFVNNAGEIINLISQMPEAFPISDYKNVRKAVVCKQISLLYVAAESEIILLRFWNNRQNPEELKL